MRIGVIGTGHVGLVTCATLAEIGHEVVGIDADHEKINLLQTGGTPFFEPQLDDLLVRGSRNGRLRFTTDIAEAIPGTDVVFICVGTPPRATGEANLSAVERASRDVARHATGPIVVVDKSTVPAGTAARVRRALHHERPDLSGEMEVVSNPEFLREGRAVEDSLNPDRILVGAESDWAFNSMRHVYKPLTDKGCPLIETNIKTAELAKHACNAFLAMKISYANALARICERAGADVTAVADVMGADSRIGRAFLNAGLGYGGYCFPKDIQAFERLSARLGYDFSLLREVARINDESVAAAVEKVKDALWNLEDKRVALLGLAFKPGTDDVRFSPALAVARQLIDEGANVVGCDPAAAANAKSEIPDLEIAPGPYEAVEGAHCALLCTEWDEFKELDLSELKKRMAYPVLVDGRNLFNPADMEAAELTYYSMGKSSMATEV
jgi:UDPglucose 6-dehydrogenase